MSLAPFIVLEGLDGCGKTTQIELLRGFFSSRVPVVTTREPGGTPMAEEIRDTLLKPRHEEVFPDTELCLFFAARYQHIRNFIRPSREKGYLVLCDRFIYSSYIYQVQNKKASSGLFDVLTHHFIKDEDKPTLTIVLDVDKDTLTQRMKDKKGVDRLDADSLKFHESIVTSMKVMEDLGFERNKVVVDGNGDPYVVLQRIIKVLEQKGIEF